ncbi:MAG: type II restriction endonuclease [Saprospiraceae bacterium]
MNKHEFLAALQSEILEYNKIIATEKGDWIVKGFIDIYKNIYTISVDTKVVSKVIELLLIPAFEKFAKQNDLTLENQSKQNFYPDLTFISNKSGEKFAVDVKSTVKDSGNNIKGMTLGTFQGYFRNRNSNIGESISYPYNDYSCHIVLGVIYSQVADKPNEKDVYSLAEIESIESVIKDFQFFAQPKYKIASAIKGSGNTRNIGSTRIISELMDGTGIFSKLGEEVFDDYWMYFVDEQSSKEKNIPRPYTNLKSYLEYKERGLESLHSNKEIIEKLKEEEPENEID